MAHRLRYVAPNAVTSLSLVFALSSLFCSFTSQFEWAGWLILWCVLLDKADGALARLLDASTDFGMELDSLVDLVAFGVAPGLLAFAAMTGPLGGEVSPIAVGPAVSLYVVCVALRLALFNSMGESTTSWAFRGVPSTLSGAVLASGFLVWMAHGAANQEVLKAGLAMGLVALGLLMVSPFPLPKLKPRKNPVLNGLQILAVLVGYCAGMARVLPEILCALAVFYLVVGLLVGSAFRPSDPVPASPE